MPYKKLRYFAVVSDYTDGDIAGPFRETQLNDTLIHTGNVSVSGDIYTHGRKVATNDSYGSYYFVTSSATVLTSGIWKKIAGTTAPHWINTFTMSQNNRLLYTASLGRGFHAETSLSINLSAPNANVSIAFCQNGEIVSSSIGHHFHKTAGEPSRGSFVTLINLSYGSTIEIWTKSDKNCNLDVMSGYVCLAPA